MKGSPRSATPSLMSTCDNKWKPKTPTYDLYNQHLHHCWIYIKHHNCSISTLHEIWEAEFCSHINGLVQDCSNSSALVMELLQSCTKPSINIRCRVLFLLSPDIHQNIGNRATAQATYFFIFASMQNPTEKTLWYAKQFIQYDHIKVYICQ